MKHIGTTGLAIVKFLKRQFGAEVVMLVATPYMGNDVGMRL